jgi:hypothetical protein
VEVALLHTAEEGSFPIKFVLEADDTFSTSPLSMLFSPCISVQLYIVAIFLTLLDLEVFIF